MYQLTTKKRAQVIAALVEGNSLRAIVRMTGVAMNTILKLIAELGPVCAEYQNRVLRNLSCKRIQCDEIWAFCYAKEKNVPQDKQGILGYGDVWTWVAICADTKIVPCWQIGYRDAWAAQKFMYNLASRLANRVQLTTDGHSAYINSVIQAFDGEIDYAMLVKVYGPGPDSTEIRYSPPEYVSCSPKLICGFPKRQHVSTSFAERQNLTMRMSMRRFTRLTNAHSKKLENHQHAVSIHYMHYNFARIHQTLRVTPAMAAGIADHVWSIEEIIDLMTPAKLETAA